MAGLGVGQTASLEVGKEANPREQGVALGEEQEGQMVVVEVVAAGVAVADETADVKSDG